MQAVARAGSTVHGLHLAQVLITNHFSALSRVENAGLLTERAVATCIDATVVDALANADAGLVPVPAASLPATRSALLDKADVVAALLRGMYLGDASTPSYPMQQLLSHLTTASVNISVWTDAPSLPNGGFFTTSLVTPWFAGRAFVTHARMGAHDAAAAAAAATTTLQTNRVRRPPFCATQRTALRSLSQPASSCEHRIGEALRRGCRGLPRVALR